MMDEIQNCGNWNKVLAKFYELRKPVSITLSSGSKIHGQIKNHNDVFITFIEGKDNDTGAEEYIQNSAIVKISNILPKN